MEKIQYVEWTDNLSVDPSIWGQIYLHLQSFIIALVTKIAACFSYSTRCSIRRRTKTI